MHDDESGERRVRRETEPSTRAPVPEEPDEVARRADQEHLKELQRARQARVAKVVVALAIVVILIIFVIANAKAVPVSFVFVTGHPKLIWVMLSCAILGAVVGYLIGRPSKHARLHRQRDAERPS